MNEFETNLPFPWVTQDIPDQLSRRHGCSWPVRHYKSALFKEFNAPPLHTWFVMTIL